MTVSYDEFTTAFLNKITEYTFVHLNVGDREAIVESYMKNACSDFAHICRANITEWDDETRSFDLTVGNTEISRGELYEIIDIVSDGMVYQWFKQFMYAQENLQNMLNTADFTSYSPAELLYRLTTAYKQAERNFTNRMREYSYRYGDLTVLHI